MPKKKRSGTQKKSKKTVPDTVVLLPDSLLKKYKNVNRNRNVNVNIIQNKISVPAPKKSRRRTARAVKTGNVRVQGPGMLFSSPPITIQTPSYGTPPYPIQPVSSRPVIPGMYDDPDRHRISIMSDTKANPIIGNVNPNNIEPVNNQARIVPSLVPTNTTMTGYDDSYETPQDISMGLDKILANINPFAGLNTARADMLPMASEPYEQPAPEYMGPDPGLDMKEEAVSSEPAVSSQAAVSSMPKMEMEEKNVGKDDHYFLYTLEAGQSLPSPPEGYTYRRRFPRVGDRLEGPSEAAIRLSTGVIIAATDDGMPIYVKKSKPKPRVGASHPDPVEEGKKIIAEREAGPVIPRKKIGQ